MNKLYDYILLIKERIDQNAYSKKISKHKLWILVFLGIIVYIVFLQLEHFSLSKGNIKLNIKTFVNKSLHSNDKVTYYVDCIKGLDSQDGLSPNRAWKSLQKANTAVLSARKSLLLKKGCTWQEPLVISSSGSSTQNIIIGAYGDGDMPVIQNSMSNVVTIKGSYITIQNIHAKVVATNFDTGCLNNPKGEISGFIFEPNSSYNTLQNSKATGAYAGVFIKNNSHHNKIQNNQFIDNNMMYLDSASDNDHGAFGVLLWGDDNEISYNFIRGSTACSYDYLTDGSAVEVYGGQRNIIKHNKAYDNEAFTELGNFRSSENIYAYNLVISSLPRSYFLITRGISKWGPVYRTSAYNNTVYLTGKSSSGFACLSCDIDILTLENNIIWGNGKIGYLEGSFNEGHNIYWGSSVNFPINSTSKIANPQFIFPGLNFHLRAESPAIDSGVLTQFTNDLDNKKIPQGSGTDIGAFEY